ncbi:serine/threonine protein kinase [Antrihabitans sp. YC3-6]|uniref:non-specific serine/threonine protein kinase n=1 Tax=Antrihabitans stalagmiti TaxID=2799499 RepID=A0A934U4V3_9NOCA|nr:serine/threonine-protein kinase [Antrihabitans stalagmiti]MBJ8340890.1 serine/threonine protein kinase [Antrihabitans stalagmiti]
MLLQPDQRISDCVVRVVLGRGGTSTVYLAENTRTGELEALKILNPDVVVHEAVRARFRCEFDIAKMLEHPNIVDVHDFGDYDGQQWMTMQYIFGVSGTALIPRPRARPDLALVLGVLAQMAAGLDYAHARGVLHRDVKPSNFLIAHAAPRNAVLTDFGIARMIDNTRPRGLSGHIVGSLPYAAPEVLQAQPLSVATDVYALASSTVELLTGKPPFPLPNMFAITSAQISSPPPVLSRRRRWIPATVDPIISRALAKQPGQRYTSCSEFVELVTHALRGFY